MTFSLTLSCSLHFGTLSPIFLANFIPKMLVCLLKTAAGRHWVFDASACHGKCYWSPISYRSEGSAWVSQPVTVRVLVAFRAIYDKDFATAMQILETDFEEVKKTTGRALWSSSL
jgi:hypothetical protein